MYTLSWSRKSHILEIYLPGTNFVLVSVLHAETLTL